MSNYNLLKESLAKGWNTWNTRSVLSHLLLPEGFAVNLGIKEYSEGAYLKEALIGRMGEGVENVIPGPHAYDGSYTQLKVLWKGIEVVVESASVENDLLILVTPISQTRKTPTLIIESGVLWNRDGVVSKIDNQLIWTSENKTVKGYWVGTEIIEPNVQTQTSYVALKLDTEVGFSTGQKRDLNEIKNLILHEKQKLENQKKQYGDFADVYDAIQTCLAWDTIYDPLKNRVITPVSRIWNCNHGGYALFCWDTYFAAYM